MVGHCLLKSLHWIIILAENALQVVIQALHMSFHNLDKQRLFIWVMVIDTGCLYACHTCDITQWRGVIAIFSKELDGCCQDTFAHRTAFRPHNPSPLSLLLAAVIVAEVGPGE